MNHLLAIIIPNSSRTNRPPSIRERILVDNTFRTNLITEATAIANRLNDL